MLRMRKRRVHKTAAVIPSTGIGDALLMMVASHALLKKSYEVTTYHRRLQEMQEWFVGHQFKPTFSLDDLQGCDLIILQNNNSKRVSELIEARTNHTLKHLSIFYPTYKKGKHPPLSKTDRVFDGKKTMVENIASETAALLQEEASSTDNGLIVLKELTHRLHPNRIVIQPLSTDPKRTWLSSRFIKLAKKLRGKGFEPIFTLTPNQQADPRWQESGIEIPSFKSLSELTSYVYESGFVIGNDSLLPHIASNLNIPHLVIGHLEDHMRLWQPGWLKGKLIMPPSWAPNIKFFRSRDTHWKQWITVREVLRGFDKLLCCS